MKRNTVIKIAVMLLLICMVGGPALAQDAKPIATAEVTPNAKPITEVKISDDLDKLRIQAQVLLQENATLRKQLAQTQQQLGQVNGQLADLNEQAIQSGGSQLLKQIADKNKVDIAKYDLQVGANEKGEQELKFVLKPEPKEPKK